MQPIQLDLEDDLAALLRPVNPSLSGAVRELLVLELYRRGTVSSGKAAQWLGMSREQFILHASRLGIPYLDMTADEWEAELQRSSRL